MMWLGIGLLAGLGVLVLFVEGRVTYWRRLLHAILVTLSDRRPRWGLEIAQCVVAVTEGELVPGPGSLYAALRALEDKGYVESWEADYGLPQRGGRPRRYYRITEKAVALLPFSSGES